MLKSVPFPDVSRPLLCDVSTGAPRIIVPKSLLTHVHVDIVGPLPAQNSFRYLLTAVDRTTRWTEVAPLVDTSASSVLNAFVNTWVARFGIPEVVQ